MREHGAFQLTRHQRVILAVVSESWNIETATRYTRELLTLADEMSAEGAWALLVDARGWQLATPEVMPQMQALSLEVERRQLAATVYLNDDSAMKAALVHETLFGDNRPTPARLVNDPEAAISWLQRKGFTVPESLRQLL